MPGCGTRPARDPAGEAAGQGSWVEGPALISGLLLAPQRVVPFGHPALSRQTRVRSIPVTAGYQLRSARSVTLRISLRIPSVVVTARSGRVGLGDGFARFIDSDVKVVHAVGSASFHYPCLQILGGCN